MGTPDQHERRRFHRILFDSVITIYIGNVKFTSTLVDISLNGVLLARPDKWPSEVNEPVEIDILLDQGEIHIKMTARLAHQETETIGLKCQSIDIESIGHLRRLVELNIGDTDLLNRDIEALG